MKVELAVPGSVCRRGEELVITTEDGRVEKCSLNPEGSEPSACMAKLSRMPGYKEAYRVGMKIYRDRWRSPWWDKQYELHKRRFHGEYFTRLQDYIVARTLYDMNRRRKSGRF